MGMGMGETVVSMVGPGSGRKRIVCACAIIKSRELCLLPSSSVATLLCRELKDSILQRTSRTETKTQMNCKAGPFLFLRGLAAFVVVVRL